MLNVCSCCAPAAGVLTVAPRGARHHRRRRDQTVARGGRARARRGLRPLGVITLAVPNPVWALALAALGAALGIGALTARGPLRPASWAAAVLGLIVISAAGALANAPADGIRGAGPIALAALVHTVLALRSSPRPLASDEATVVERTTAPEGQ